MEIKVTRREKIESFRALGANWNSYGCEPFSHASVDAALALESNIPADFDTVLPIAGRGVMFGKNGDQITIEIFSDVDLRDRYKSP